MMMRDASFGALALLGFCVFEALLLRAVLPPLDAANVLAPLEDPPFFLPEDVFDTTIWTWGTDYVISFALGCLIFAKRDAFCSPRARSASGVLIVVSNALSTLLGGVAHQLAGLSDNKTQFMNSPLFRYLWFSCIGSVVFSGCVQGIKGNEIAASTPQSRLLPIPKLVWIIMYAAALLWVFFGGLSCRRAAYDVFLCGAVQAPGAIFLYLAVIESIWMQMGKNKRVDKKILPVFAPIFGLAPTIFLYPLLAGRLPPPAMNAFLHAILLIAWTLQGYSLAHLEESTNRKKKQ